MLINLEAPASVGRPSSEAVLAMLPLLFSDPAGALGQLVHEHGPLVLLEVGPVQALLVTDPALLVTTTESPWGRSRPRRPAVGLPRR